MRDPTKSISVCTIIARNYLAHARVLGASFLDHHPNDHFYLLCIDDPSGYFDPTTEIFEVITLDKIPLPESAATFCFKYNVTELATAVKPFFLRWLFNNRGEPDVFYLDPDILITAPLEDLHERLCRGEGLLLTPHLDTDYPVDGKLPDDRTILSVGAFNLGFLGIKKGALGDRVLTWFEGKTADHCVDDKGWSLFVDQKFFDLALSLFPGCDVERGPGYNVAYWNLHSRHLIPDPSGAGNSWLCNGEPLRFFHFSGYNPARPEQISRHLNRFTLAERQDLQAIFVRYREALVRQGHEQTRTWNYGHDRFANGRVISESVRRAYRLWADEQSPRPTWDPFTSPSLARVAAILDAFGWVENIALRGYLSLRARAPALLGRLLPSPEKSSPGNTVG